jgi:CrcB protein
MPLAADDSRHEVRVDYVWVALGGGVGAVTRYAVGQWIVSRAGTGFPLHTLLINVTGSLAIGIVLTLLTERLLVDPAWRLLLVVGFLGGYTTFSSYTYEALALVEAGEVGSALAYALFSNVVGLGAALLGIVIARSVATA